MNATGSMWRRSLLGTWRHCSRKHLARYLKEVVFRLNEGSVRHHTLNRIGALVLKAFHHRITWGR